MNQPNSSGSATFDTVCVIGLGYIGLPTAAFIASRGIKVVGVDVNEDYVNQINAGKVPFYEPGFEDILASVVSDGLLVAQAETPEADAYIIAVPTPFKDGHEVDMKYIEAASASLAPRLKGGDLVILESTCPPGTTQKTAEFIVDLRPDLTLTDGQPNTIYMAHAPERVLPGKIMVEMAENDRVIGGLTDRASELARDLYATFSNGNLLLTDSRTAEMVKLTENSFRDVNIAFANELSTISEKLGIDVWELIRLANHHPRVNILQPGPGVGGHCIAVDPWFIVAAAPEEARLIKTARETNDQKPHLVVENVKKALERLENPVIAALGIAFKSDIGDVRQSPSLQIVADIARSLPSGDIRVVEPFITELPTHVNQLANVSLENIDEAIRQADLILMLVDHTAFKRIEPSVLRGKIIVDTKGILPAVT